MVQDVTEIVPVPVLTRAFWFAAAPATKIRLDCVKLADPLRVRQFVVPARKSHGTLHVELAIKPPPADAPAAAFDAVVSVARARAWPVPDPTPEAWKIVPTVLAAAPGKLVVPEVVISYHWPETNDPALTVGLFAPPMFKFWSITIEKPLEYTVSPLPGRTPPFHVDVALQFPEAIARAVAIIRFLSPR